MFLLPVISVSEPQRAEQAFKWHRIEAPQSGLSFGPVDIGHLELVSYWHRVSVSIPNQQPTDVWFEGELQAVTTS